MFFESFGVMACLRLDLYTTSVRCLAASICMIYALLHDSHNPQIVRPTGSKTSGPTLPECGLGHESCRVSPTRRSPFLHVC